MVTIKRILCPVDFSEVSIRALEYAISFAESVDARVTPLHVVEGFIERPGLDVNAHFNVPEFRRYLAEDAMTRLKAAVAQADSSRISEPQVISGTPSREILRIAAEHQTDLIVLGVYGSGIADGLGFGSTTHDIVRKAACPVLTVRAERERL